MERFDAIARGIQQFASIGHSQTGSFNTVSDLVWLSKRAVQEDKVLNGLDQHGAITDVNLYFQRLLEIGFIFNEVFVQLEYPWKPQCETPRVIDLGGDIAGFSVLYWKSLAPRARITLVEANPSTAAILSENLKRKGLQDVEVINAAVAEREGKTTLHVHKPGGYHPSDFIGARTNLEPTWYHTVSVPTIKPSKLIGEEQIDLLKVDVEGAEGEVFRELAVSGKIGQIDEVIMEFHNDPRNPTNSLLEVLQILEDAIFV